MNRFAATVAAAALVVGCAKHQTPVQSAFTAPPRELAPLDAPTTGGAEASRSQVVVSDRIREACGISEAASFFEYDSARVSPTAMTMLKRLANCFTTGPLREETMQLVGHADPRGSDEYNMVLGSRRAESVKGALGGFGLSASSVTTSSRGEMEATGIDSETWAQDRRVNVTTRN